MKRSTRNILLSLVWMLGGTFTLLTGQTWTQLLPAGGPTGRVLDAQVGVTGYDPVSNRLIVYFPTNPAVLSEPPAEVWVLTNANGLGGTPAWIQLTINGTPPATDYTNGAYDPITNRLIVYGGCYSNCGFAQSDVIALTNANGLGGQPAWTPVSVTNPRPRDGHTAVFDSIHNLMITFGGGLAFYGTDQNDTAVLTNANGAMSPSSWSTLATLGGPPDNREEAGANYDEIRNRMILFAGNRLNSNFTVTEFNDVWTLSNANGLGGLPNWTLLSPTGIPPHTRLRHSQVYDSNNNRMIVFGGSTEVPCCSVFGDLWQLSNANGLGGPSAWTQLTPTGTLPGPT